MFVLFTMFAAATAQLSVQLTHCNTNLDCQTYGDTVANCAVGRVCSCTSPDTSDFCSGNMTSTTGVTYVLTFNFDCDRFFTNPRFMRRLRLSVERTVSAGEIALDVTFSCGSVKMFITGEIPLPQVTSLGADLQTNVEADIVGDEMSGTLLESNIAMDAGSSSRKCHVSSPVASAVYIDTTNTCVISACEDGYELVAASPDFVNTCTEMKRAEDSDDDLSDGAIAAIVLACVGAFCLAVAAAVFCCVKSKKKVPENGQKLNDSPFDVVV